MDVADLEGVEQAFCSFVGQLGVADCAVGMGGVGFGSGLRVKVREAFFRGVQQAAQEAVREGSVRGNWRRRRNRRGLYSRS